jgi:16S rRNA (adenine1518-N6/adenine1519-N6)-dimethyltransferase
MSRQKLGQHFLASRGILERIAAAACPPDTPLVIEIGPGQGALTEHLLERARRVVAIELDPGMVERLRHRLAGEPRLEIIHGDALQVDLTQWGPAVIAGNLPYYVATPILERAVMLGPGFSPGVYLIQKEVAERVTAAPGAKAYGYLTVRLELFARRELLFTVKPGAFRPPPKVESAVVRLTWQPRAGEMGIADPERFLRFVSASFRHKRKTVRNNLTSVYPLQAIDSLPLAGHRAEALSLAQFADLYHRVVL